jgi:hypothetical protein
MLKKVLLAAVAAAATLTAVSAANASGGCGWRDHRGVYGGCHTNPYGGLVATTPGGRNVILGHTGPRGGIYINRGWHGAWSPGWGAWHPGWGPSPGIFSVGVLGVAIGASLAAPYYGPPPAYYAGPGYWGYWQGCRSYWRWAPALGYYVPANTCN